jgi:hypothetical protein
MSSLELDNKTIFTIKSEIEEEFKKNYGKPYDWTNIFRSTVILKVMEDLKLSKNISADLAKFRTAIQLVLRNSDKYQFVEQIDNDKVSYKLKRKNKFEDVTNYNSLKKAVYSFPGGLFVD